MVATQRLLTGAAVIFMSKGIKILDRTILYGDKYYMICNPDILNVLKLTPGFKLNPCVEDTNTRYFVGRLCDMKVFAATFWENSCYAIGYRGWLHISREDRELLFGGNILTKIFRSVKILSYKFWWKLSGTQ